MLAIDTNVLVRLLARDSIKQADAAESAVAKGAWISHLVLIETMWVLGSVYERTNAQLAAAIELLLAHEQLVVQDAHVVKAALAHFKRKSAPGFSDCLVLEVAKAAGHTPLATFDKAFAKLEGMQRL